MKNEKVLVVGGAGYIGSHMVKDLLDTGYDVITLDDLSAGHRELLSGGEFIEGGLGDTVLLDNLFSTHTISAVMHFAAFCYVGESMTDPAKYYENNIVNTLALLEGMLEKQLDHLLL